MIEIKSFQNKSNKQIHYLSIPTTSAAGKSYEMKVGIKKAKAILENATEIESLLK